MDHAAIFVLGIFLLPLAFVSIVSAWTHGHPPRTALVLILISSALIGFVAYDRPQGLYALSEIPPLITRVIARLMSLS